VVEGGNGAGEGDVAWADLDLLEEVLLEAAEEGGRGEGGFFLGVVD
jgi:hypothetical protein